MRPPRVKFTVRGMMSGVAVVGLVLGFAMNLTQGGVAEIYRWITNPPLLIVMGSPFALAAVLTLVVTLVQR